VEIPARVPGTAVFMTGSRDGTPPAMLHNFLHNRVVHQHVVLLTIVTQEVARVSERERFTREELPDGFVRIVAAVRLHGAARRAEAADARRHPRR
jgi:KUP system potassium uptake protein